MLSSAVLASLMLALGAAAQAPLLLDCITTPSVTCPGLQGRPRQFNITTTTNQPGFPAASQQLEIHPVLTDWCSKQINATCTLSAPVTELGGRVLAFLISTNVIEYDEPDHVRLVHDGRTLVELDGKRRSLSSLVNGSVRNVTTTAQSWGAQLPMDATTLPQFEISLSGNTEVIYIGAVSINSGCTQGSCSTFSSSRGKWQPLGRIWH